MGNGGVDFRRRSVTGEGGGGVSSWCLVSLSTRFFLILVLGSSSFVTVSVHDLS
jgi:hypothetical protein